MAFNPDDILPWLPSREVPSHVAYSGGMDSHVLLHAMAILRDAGKLAGPLRAIHVHHGLHADADAWTEHCRQVCAGLNVPIEVVKVQVDNQGQGLEQAARDARYTAMTALLQPGDSLLTAHHLDDQAETLLFRLMRGTGVRGMAGIRRARVSGKNVIRRPLLDFTREELLEYASREQLDWIVDDSNSNESLDRNYLRHTVLPVLAERWPGYRKTWQRFASLALESHDLAHEVGGYDLQEVMVNARKLSIPALRAFSPVRQRNILRTWFFTLEFTFDIRMPDAYVIDRILGEVIPAAEDAEPQVNWCKDERMVEVRRFAEHLYLVLPLPPLEPALEMDWQCDSPLVLPAGLGTLSLCENTDAGFILPPDGRLCVRFRAGGETAKPVGRKTRPLKKILQDYRVPPWVRDNLPLVYHQDELLAVADLFVSADSVLCSSAAKEKKIYGIQWHRPELHCGY